MAVKESRAYDALFGKQAGRESCFSCQIVACYTPRHISQPMFHCADTTYTVSGARDHYKQQGQAGFVLKQVPEHANFFSDLKHYPKSTFRFVTLFRAACPAGCAFIMACADTPDFCAACRVKAGAQLPASIDRNFHPHQHIPQLLKWQSSSQQVNGPQLFKYFRRPLLPAGASLTLQLRLAPQQPAPQPPPPVPEPPTKDAGKSFRLSAHEVSVKAERSSTGTCSCWPASCAVNIAQM
jgi:hypothetical protein